MSEALIDGYLMQRPTKFTGEELRIAANWMEIALACRPLFPDATDEELEICQRMRMWMLQEAALLLVLTKEVCEKRHPSSNKSRNPPISHQTRYPVPSA